MRFSEFFQVSHKALAILREDTIPVRYHHGSVKVEWPEGAQDYGPGVPWIDLPSGKRLASTGPINEQSLHIPGERCLPAEMTIDV